MIKDDKAKMFHPRMGRAREIFSLVWQLAIYRANILYTVEILPYITADIQSKRPYGAIIAPTTFIIIVIWWQHHHTNLPMARRFTNTCSLSSRYMISMS
jgi:hypothetical protein